MKLIVAAIAASVSGSAFAAAGDLDCTFGIGGKAQYDFGPSGSDAFFQALLQPDGKLVTVGSGNGIRLTRLTAGGDLDATFGNGGSITHSFPGLGFTGYVTRDSQGRLLVGGRITVSGDTQAFVARFTDTGAIDTTFGGGDGWTSFNLSLATTNAGDDILGGIAVDSLDRPVIAGTADPNGNVFNPSNSDVVVARLTTAGVLDTTFSGDGLASVSTAGSADDRARGVRVDASNRIVAFGDASPSGNVSPRNSLVARFNTDGSLDATFDGDGLRILDATLGGGDDFAIDLEFANDGDLMVLSVDSDDPILARMNPDGSLDTSFGGDGIVTRSFVGGQDVTEDVVVQADGKFIVTGWPVVGSIFHLASMRFEADGDLDTTWGGTGVVTTNVAAIDRGYDAVMQPNGRLVIVGGADNDIRALAVRYLADGDGIALNTTTAITSDTPDPSVLGQSVAVGVSVTSSGGFAPTGGFTVSDGAARCTGTLAAATGNSATGTCNVVLNAGGNRTLTAQYEGASGSCRSSATTAHTVNRPATSIAITSDTPDPSIQGQPVTVAWTVSSGTTGTPTGNVTVTDGVNTCTADATAGSCSVTIANSGDRQLAASYAGDASFAPSSTATNEPHVVLVQVTPSAGANGSITPSTPQTGTRLSTIPFTLVPDAGYHVDTATGCSGTRNGNTFTTGPLIGNCTVSVTFNADPVAVPGDLFVGEDSGANAAQLFANDADALTFAIATQPAKGTVAIVDAATGAYTYTPNANAVGADSFTFRASDAGGSSAPGTITIAIAPVNDAPSLALASLPTIPGGTTSAQSFPAFATFDAGPADEDATQAVSAYLVDSVDDPSGVLVVGSVSVAPNGTLALTPTGAQGTATIAVRVRDDGGTANGGIDTSAPQSATITVLASADLQVAKDDGRVGVVSGDIVTYAIVATNAGPSAVTGARLADDLPATLANASWTCRAELSTVPCPPVASGTGDIDIAIDLPVGGVLRFDLTATVAGATGAFVVNTATIATPAGTTSLDATNDASTDQDAIVPNGVFLDGFEGSGSGLTVPAAQAVMPR
ncbi:MAG TPA: Ig-like domain repeat protein [Xanthomonadales bacterium]|nr:Ig-like domain repeat protein [Xanthomonadales bacterium]